jgi:hypothetical protein
VSHKPECNEKWEYDKDHCICSWIEKAEQRIIELLDEAFIYGTPVVIQREQLIALIKGDNK